jgi:hypothetical protein
MPITSCSTTDPNCTYIPAISEPVQNPIYTAESSTVIGAATLNNVSLEPLDPIDTSPISFVPIGNPEEDASTNPVYPDMPANPIDGDLPSIEDPGGFRTAALRVLRYLSGPFASLFGTVAFTLSLLGAYCNARRGMSLSGPAWVATLTILLINAEQIVTQILSL